MSAASSPSRSVMRKAASIGVLSAGLAELGHPYLTPAGLPILKVRVLASGRSARVVHSGGDEG